MIRIYDEKVEMTAKEVKKLMDSCYLKSLKMKNLKLYLSGDFINKTLTLREYCKMMGWRKR